MEKARLTIIDRALQVIAPSYAERRVAARIRTNVLLQSGYYNGASKSYRTAGWSGRSGDANRVTQRETKPLREVARNLDRNNPIAVRAKSVLVNNAVGSGINPHAESDDKDRKKEVETLLSEHCNSTAIDADGVNNLAGIQRLAFGAVVSDGECLIRRRRRRASDGLPLPFQLQVLEADYLDSNKNVDLAGKNRIIQGVEFNGIGRRVAYWLFDEHPQGQQYSRRLTSRRVPASEIIHLFRTDRPGQVRGVSWFAPVVSAINDVMSFFDAQLVRQKIAACFAAFRRKPDSGIAGDVKPGETGQPDTIDFKPAMITDLPPGWEIEFSDPPGVTGFDESISIGLRFIAGGIGITAESLSGNLTGVNFSSGRMGWLEMARNIDAIQYTLLLPGMCIPISAWLVDAIRIQTMNITPFKIAWAAPVREMIDPTKEVPAKIREIRAGLASRQSALRARGVDPFAVEREIAEDNETADENGFVFDSDPRLMSQGGQKHGAAASEADEEIDDQDDDDETSDDENDADAKKRSAA